MLKEEMSIIGHCSIDKPKPAETITKSKGNDTPKN